VKSRTIVLLLGTAQFIMVLDSTVMNVSISQVVDDLDTTVPNLQLAITAYTLVMAAFMLTGAKFGDIWGRRRAFAIGLGVYGIGSFITAVSPNIVALLIGWSCIEGLGAVLVIPAIAALTAASYEGRERALAFALLGGIAGAGAAAGPLIGGFVTSALTWRVVFAAESVTVAGLLLLMRRLPVSPGVPGAKMDRPGSALSALGMGLTVFGILKISSWGLLNPTGALTIGGTRITPFGLSIVPFLILAGLVVLGVFERWEQRVDREGGQPLLRPDLLRIPQMRAGASTVVSQYLILAGTFFVLPLYLQLVLEKDALQTGLKILPISITMMIAALLGPRLATRTSPRRVVQIGMGFLVVSLLGLMATISPDLADVLFAVSLAGFGAGIGLAISQLGNVVMSSVPETRSSEAGGIQGVSQNLGQSLGTALIGAVLLTGLTTGFHDRVLADSAIPTRVQQDLVAATEQGVPMISEPDAEAAAKKEGLGPRETDEVIDAYGDAQIEALKQALFIAAAFVLVGFWFARHLPGEPLSEAEEEAHPKRMMRPDDAVPSVAATTKGSA
jgi:MFS family permease